MFTIISKTSSVLMTILFALKFPTSTNHTPYFGKLGIFERSDKGVTEAIWVLQQALKKIMIISTSQTLITLCS